MSIDKNNEICNLIDVYENMLTQKQSSILKDYYFYDLSLSEIAENNGVSRQAVKDIIDRSVKQCYNLEQKLNIYKKQTETIKQINLIINGSDNAMLKNKLQNIINYLEE